MIAAALPSGFYWCLAGTAIGGGLMLFLVCRLFAKGNVFKRARSLGADEDGSTIVEFPFALITLTIVSVFTWQFGFMLSAYLVVDYAAFAAARSAIVQEADDREDMAEEAAEFACFAISGRYSLQDLQAGVGSLNDPSIPIIGQLDLSAMLDNQTLDDVLDLAAFPLRYLYTIRNTSAQIVAGQNASGGEPITVEVSHDFNLRVPIAARVLGRAQFPEGYVTTIKGYATMISDQYDNATEP